MRAYHARIGGKIGGGGQCNVRLHGAVDAAIEMACARWDDDSLCPIRGEYFRQKIHRAGR